MLPPANRLRQSRDFTTIYQGGVRRSARSLALRALQTRGASGASRQPTRIGVVVSQKVSKRAVDRNRIKRQIRSACRQLLPSLVPGWSVVLVVRHSALQCEYREILRELKQLLAEAEVLSGH